MSSLHQERASRPTAQMQRIWSGVIEVTPEDSSELLQVRIPDMNAQMVLRNVRWDSSGGLPSEGDDCLVIFDNGRIPWVVTFWPPGSTPSSEPTGPAGGDLSGSYPDPVVAQASGDLNVKGNLYLGTPLDTVLYRSSAGWLFTNNIATNHIQTADWIIAGADLYLRNANPHIWFGPNDDTSLYRAGANALQTNGSLTIANNPLISAQAASNSLTFQSYVHGDAQLRFYQDTDGTHVWGPGTGAADTKLYRTTVGQLRTDGEFMSGGRIFCNDGIWVDGGATRFIGSYTTDRIAMYISGWRFTFSDTDVFAITNPAAQITFGGDVNLYRYAANVLASNDKLVLLGNISSYFPLAPQSRNSLELWLSSASLITLGETSFGNANPALTLYRTGSGGTSGTAARLALPSSVRGFALQYGSGNYGAETYTTVLEIDQSGKLLFGPEGSQDTNLYRSSAGRLKTDSHFLTVGGVYAGAESSYAQGTAGEMWIGPEGPSGQAGLVFGGSPWDTNLYRVAANTLKTDDTFYSAKDIVANVGVVNTQIWLHTDGRIYFGSATDTSLYRAYANAVGTPGDFNAGGSLYASGASSKLFFGTAADVNLYRSGADTLSTDDAFETRGNFLYPGANLSGLYPKLYSANALGAAIGWNFSGGNAEVTFWNTYSAHPLNSTPSFQFFQMTGTSTSSHCLSIGADGKLTIGQPADTNLYRSVANSLKTDGNLIAGATLTAAWNSALALQLTGASGGITFGGDTNLYRTGAGSLKTDGNFATGSNIQSGSYVLSAGDMYCGGWMYLGYPSVDTAFVRITTGTAALLNNVGAAQTLQAAAFTVVSDRKIKSEISPIEMPTDKLLNAGIYRYRREGAEGHHVGLMADELPEEVVTRGETDAIDLYKLTTVLLATVQQMNRRLEALEGSINAS